MGRQEAGGARAALAGVVALLLAGVAAAGQAPAPPDADGTLRARVAELRAAPDEERAETLLGDLDVPALERLTRAFAGVAELGPGEVAAPLEEAAAELFLLGLDLFAAGRPVQAERALRAAFAGHLAARGAAADATMRTSSHLAGVLSDLARYEDSLAVYDALLDRARAQDGERSYLVAVVTTNRARPLFALGRDREVADAYELALAITAEVHGTASAQYATLLANTAYVVSVGGRPERAEELAREALELRVEALGEDAAEVGDGWLLLGLTLQEQARLDEAEACLLRALEIVSAVHGEEHLETAAPLRYLGLLSRDAGRSAEARERLEAARVRYERAYGPRHPDVAWVRTNLALLLSEEGRLDEALAEMERALAASTDEDGYAWASRLQTLARIQLDLGELEAAEATCRRALDVHLRVGADHARIGLSRQNLGAVLRARGRLEEAEAELRAALAIVVEGRGPEHGEVIHVESELARVLEDRGELAEALEHAARAFELADARRANVGGERERARFAARLSHRGRAAAVVRLAVRLGDAETALVAMERGRGRVLLDLLQRSERELVAGTEGGPELLAREAELRRAVEVAERARAEGRGRGQPSAEADLRAAASALDARLRAVWPAADPADVETVRAGLQPGEVLLAYSHSARSFDALLVPPAGAGEVVGATVAGGEEAARRLVDRLAALARRVSTHPRRRAAEDAPDLAREARDLLEQLVPPALREPVGRARRVVVVPDGPLELLPLDLLALAAGAGAPPVAGELVVASSASIYLNRAQAARARPADPAGQAAEGAAGRALVLADPLLRPGAAGVLAAADGRGGALPPLPSSRAEARYLERLFAASGRPVDVLVGDAASLAALEDRAPGARFLHLATHGFHGSPGEPYDASLLLAGDPARLTLDDLVRTWRGRLARCDLVVLSACDTRRGVRVGASSIALPWGFFFAGAPRVVATSWQVEDEAAALLMARFYENLLGRHDDARRAGARALEPGRPAPSALALLEAKRWLRDADRRAVREASARLGLEGGSGTRGAGAGEPRAAAGLRPYADPYFWGAFVLVGAAE